MKILLIQNKFALIDEKDYAYSKNIFFVCLLIFFVGVSACSAKQAYIQRGDIAVWINKVVPQDDEIVYAYQMRLLALQAMGKAEGVYDSIDPDLKTWDNTYIFSIHQRGICEHIDLITYDGKYNYDTDYLVILRPTTLLLSWIDMDAAIEKRLEVEVQGFTYNQPELYIISKWILSDIPWWVTETTKAHWAEVYGIDYNYGVDLKAAQWSPCLGQSCHYNFADDRFWQRDMNCSSSTWWYLWYGYFCKGDPYFDAWLINHPEWVHGSDCLAPGQIAEYLTRHRYAVIKNIYH